MKKSKFFRQLTVFVITLSMMLPSGINKSQSVVAAETDKTASQLYVEAMGKGWNLGNSFDGFDGDLTKEDSGETAWGNPVVTREFIQEIKDKGYDSIRIPMTAHRRYSLVDGKYVMDTEWLERYKEVVSWAVDSGLYVMINIHHDSWIWLSKWDGNKESVEYKTYVDLWTQLADEFKDYSDKVCFETINEPQFNDTGDIKAQDKLDMINLTAYNIIRNSGGNNATRKIVIPTMHTNHEAKNSDPAYALINGLNDENVIATVHYYSEWVFSANLGRTGFDEPLYEGNNEYTARAAAKQAFDTVYNTFTAKGIGVVVGEWGLLGYDAGAECNQLGEELKYYDYINYLANEKGISVMFWDNGSGINRLDTENYSWKKPLVGKALEAGINGERSSYATDLNTIYLSKEVDSDIKIKLTLNGNTFKGIEGLNEGVDYTYDEESATITLSSAYVNSKFNALKADEYGNIADLVVKFSAGADWHQYLVKYAQPVLSDATGTTAGISIPVKFNGSKLRRATAFDEAGNRIGPNSSWWGYLQYNSVFLADYNKDTIEIYNGFFNDGSVEDGKIKFTFEFYDGQVVEYSLVKEGTTVTGIGNQKPGTEDDGSQTPGEEQPGTEDGGSQTPGEEQPGTEDGGSQTPGEEQPGTEDGGSQTPGEEQPGTEDGGSQTPGEEQPGTEDGGSQTPGEVRPGTEEGGSQTPEVEKPQVQDQGNKDTVVAAPESVKPVTETTKNTLPKTGSAVDTTVVYSVTIMLIVLGSILFYKKKETAK